MKKSELRTLIKEMIQEELAGVEQLQEDVEDFQVDPIGLEDFTSALLVANKHKTETFGDLWEELVECNKCPYSEQCNKLLAYMKDKGKEFECRNFINVLVGDSEMDELIK